MFALKYTLLFLTVAFCSSQETFEDSGKCSNDLSRELIQEIRRLTQHISRIEQKLNSQDSVLNDQSTKLISLAGDSSSIKNEISDINKATDSQKSVLDSHTAALNSQKTILDGHTSKLNTQKFLLDAHTSKLDAHTSKLDAHTSKLDAHTSKLDSLKSVVDSQTSQFSTLGNQVSNLLPHINEKALISGGEYYIHDRWLTASSGIASCSRLYVNRYTNSTCFWSAPIGEQNHWLQANLGYKCIITSIAAGGPLHAPVGVLTYKLVYRDEDSSNYGKWEDYKENGVVKVFKASNGPYKVTDFEKPLVTYFVRLYPLTYNTAPVLVWELYGMPYRTWRTGL